MKIKRFFLVIITCLIAGILIIYFSKTAILRDIGNFLVVSQDVENADCIVVLSGDYGNRIAKGVELYKSGKANYLILTGPHLQEKYFFKEDLPCNPSWADLMKSYALRHGVERAHIYSFTTEAESTRREAELATDFIRTMNWKSFIVVTSDYHTRRSHMIFIEFAHKKGLKFYIYAAPDPVLFPKEWWTCRHCVKNVFYEYSKLLFYLIEKYTETGKEQQ